MHTRYRSLHLSIVGAPSRTVAYNIAKVQSNKIYLCCIASNLKFLWYVSMEWKLEENFTMEWKIFGMEWKWNGRKFPVWKMEKSSSIPFHTMPCFLISLKFNNCSYLICCFSFSKFEREHEIVE